MIEERFPGGFLYTLHQDPRTTGRLEATLFVNSKKDTGNGIVLHSKAQTKKYINQNYEGFLATIEEALS